MNYKIFFSWLEENRFPQPPCLIRSSNHEQLQKYYNDMGNMKQFLLQLKNDIPLVQKVKNDINNLRICRMILLRFGLDEFIQTLIIDYVKLFDNIQYIPKLTRDVQLEMDSRFKMLSVKLTINYTKYLSNDEKNNFLKYLSNKKNYYLKAFTQSMAEDLYSQEEVRILSLIIHRTPDDEMQILNVINGIY